MEQHEREYRDLLDQGLSGIEPDSGLYRKVRGGIEHQKEHLHRRNIMLGTTAAFLMVTVLFSSVTPVFGRNGTLPQVLTAMAAEHQAKTVLQTLGGASVQQTGAALQTSAATLQTVSNSTLSETDSILALVVANRSGRSVEDVLTLRAQGIGWGRIMTQLGVSGRDIGAAVSRVQTAAAATVAVAVPVSVGTPSVPQGQGAVAAVSNRNGTKIVVNGEITVISPAAITVAGKVLTMTAATMLKYHGKSILPAEVLAKLATGRLYATVQGTQLSPASLQADLVIVQDGAAAMGTPGSTTPVAAGSTSDQQARGKVTAVSATLLHIDGYAHDIVLTAVTKVEQTGAGKATIADIRVGQTVRVHVNITGTAYTATQVHIEDKDVKSTPEPEMSTDPSVKTWQGTIASVVLQSASNPAGEPMIGVVVLAESGQPAVYWVLPTSVLQDAGGATLTLAQLQALPDLTTRKVTIQGKLLADGSVDIIKLTVTTTGTGNTTNPGKGNGKDKSGKH